MSVSRTILRQPTRLADLRSILSPRCVARARDVAALMTKADESFASAADLLEEAARH